MQLWRGARSVRRRFGVVLRNRTAEERRQYRRRVRNAAVRAWFAAQEPQPVLVAQIDALNPSDGESEPGPFHDCIEGDVNIADTNIASQETLVDSQWADGGQCDDSAASQETLPLGGCHWL